MVADARKYFQIWALVSYSDYDRGHLTDLEPSHSVLGRDVSFVRQPVPIPAPNCGRVVNANGVHAERH